MKETDIDKQNYVSYAKDVFIELYRKEIGTATMNSIVTTAKNIMELAISLIKQARESFNEKQRHSLRR